MDEPIFADKQRPPTDPELATVLGRAKTHWNRLLTAVEDVSPGAPIEWKYYSAKSGWSLVVRGKSRNLLYVSPRKGSFLVSFAFGDKAIEAAAEADLPAELLASIRAAPKYPEGRPVRVQVRTAADALLARKLLAIKAAN